MTPTDEAIDRLKADAKWLFDIISEYHRTAHGSDTQETELWAIGERIEKAVDMLLAMKARVEAAEKRVAELENDLASALWASGIGELKARAEAAEQKLHELTEGYRGELESLEVLADARERDHNNFRLDNDREWKAKVDYQKVRAEVAEKALQECEATVRNALEIEP